MGGKSTALTVDREKLGQMMIDLRKDVFAEAYEATLPITMRKYMTIDKAVNTIGRAVQVNPKLLACDIKTIQQSLIDAAALGLELAGPMKEAHIVPYWNGKRQVSEAQMQIGFGGYLELMERTGKYAGAPIVQWVYERDTFDLNLIDPGATVHRPFLGEMEERGEAKLVYLYIRYRAGGVFFDYRTMGQILKHRERYVRKDRSNNWPGPWDDEKNWPEFLEMGRKTMIRLCQKHLSKSPEMAKAVEYDGAQEMGGQQPIIKWADLGAEPQEPAGAPPSRTDEALAALKGKQDGAQEPANVAPTTEPPPPEVEGSKIPTSKMDPEEIQAYYNEIPAETFKKLEVEAGMTSDKRTRNSTKKRDSLIVLCEKWLDDQGFHKKEAEAAAAEKPPEVIVPPPPADPDPPPADPPQEESSKKNGVKVQDNTPEHQAAVRYIRQNAFEADPENARDADILLMIKGVTGYKSDTLEAVPMAVLQAYMEARNNLQLKLEG